MKSSTLRRFIAVHTWVGLIAGFALLFAWIYWSMARAVLRRGLHGDPHSVGSLQALPG